MLKCLKPEIGFYTTVCSMQHFWFWKAPSKTQWSYQRGEVVLSTLLLCEWSIFLSKMLASIFPTTFALVYLDRSYQRNQRRTIALRENSSSPRNFETKIVFDEKGFFSCQKTCCKYNSLVRTWWIREES